VKNAANYARKLHTLLKKIAPSGGFEPLASVDPTTRLVVGFLQWNATTRQAENALQRLMGEVVDNNDLRVTHPAEVAGILGPRYPRAEERAARLRDALQAVYQREHATSLDALAGKAKKDVRAYLDSLPGIVPYVSAYVMLVGYGGHAAPLDEKLLELLRQQEVVDPSAELEEVAGFLERHIRAEDALEAHLALQAWADDPSSVKLSPGGRATRSKATTKKTTKKKTTKKTPTKKPSKKTSKKSTKKKTTRKKTTKKSRTSKRTTRSRR
jgi:hypothetical protein